LPVRRRISRFSKFLDDIHGKKKRRIMKSWD
jgi:hypothetical protein